MKTQYKRKQKGSTLVLVIVLTVAAMLLLSGLAKLWMGMGGAKESQDATEAGALNMASETMNQIRVMPENDDEKQFCDVADSKGGFELANINRVWAKTLLASINVAGMESTGHSLPAAREHADRLFSAAKSINNRLEGLLEDPTKRYGFFDDMAANNVISMTQSQTRVQALQNPSYWTSSLVDRGGESNIILNDAQIPEGYDQSTLPLTAPIGGNNHYLLGYQPISIFDKKFCFVPFKQNEPSVLISAETFGKSTLAAQPLAAIDHKPIPNAYSVEGKTTKDLLQGTAFVLANPQRPLKMAMPGGFIRLSLLENTCRAMVGTFPWESLTYGYKSKREWVWPRPAIAISLLTMLPEGVSAVIGTFGLGTEFGDHCSVYKAIFNRSLNAETLKVLLQRCQEIKPDCTQDELLGLLYGQPANTGDFIIFAESNAPGAKLRIAPAPMVKSINPAINLNGQSDGASFKISEEGMQSIWSLDSYPYCIPLDPTGHFRPDLGVSFIREGGNLNWAPGSGFDGCLGTLTVQHHTEVVDGGVVLVVH